MENDAGNWLLLVNNEEYGRYYNEETAIDRFELYLESDDYFSGDKVELVRVLRTTNINEEISKHYKLDTIGDWRLYPSIEGIKGKE